MLARLDGETRTDEGGQILKLRDPFLRKSHAPGRGHRRGEGQRSADGPEVGRERGHHDRPARRGRARGAAARRAAQAARRAGRHAGVEARRRPAFERRGPQGVRRRREERGRATTSSSSIARSPRRTPASASPRARAPCSSRSASARERPSTPSSERRPPATHADVVKATEHVGARDRRRRPRARASATRATPRSSSPTSPTTWPRAPRGCRAPPRTGPRRAPGRARRAHGRLHVGALGRRADHDDAARRARARPRRDRRGRSAAREARARRRATSPTRSSRRATWRRDCASRTRRSARRAAEDAPGASRAAARGTPGEDERAPGRRRRAGVQHEAAHDLERLSPDHAGEMGKMEQALAGATSDEELNQMRDEAKSTRRRSARPSRRCPAVGMGSDSWTSKGAAARELAEQMARSLEEGRTDEASQSGRSALGALDEAKTTPPGGRRVRRPQRPGREARRATPGASSKPRRSGPRSCASSASGRRERARKQLERGGDEEGQLADRARELGAAERATRARFPQQAIESIEDAERAARGGATRSSRATPTRGWSGSARRSGSSRQAREQLQGEDDGAGPPPPGGDDGKAAEPRRTSTIPDRAQGARGVPPARRARARPGGERTLRGRRAALRGGTAAMRMRARKTARGPFSAGPARAGGARDRRARADVARRPTPRVQREALIAGLDYDEARHVLAAADATTRRVAPRAGAPGPLRARLRRRGGHPRAARGAASAEAARSSPTSRAAASASPRPSRSTATRRAASRCAGRTSTTARSRRCSSTRWRRRATR